MFYLSHTVLKLAPIQQCTIGKSVLSCSSMDFTQIGNRAGVYVVEQFSFERNQIHPHSIQIS
jgi:hypothetical protein